MEGEWSLLQKVVSLMEGAWSCYRGGQFNGRQNGHVTEVASLMEGEEWSCYRGGQFKGGRIIMLQRWSVLMEGEMVML